MTHTSFPFGLDTNHGVGGSPFLSGYRGLGNDAMCGFDGRPSMSGTASTQQQAMMDIKEAANTQNPERRMQLLQQALALLKGNAGSDPMSQPMPCSAAAPGNTSTSPPMATLTSAAAASDPSSPDGLTVTGKNSVNTGEYTITASTNDDGSLTVTNNQTKQSFEIWGDPHIKVNGHNIADFQKDDLNIQLQDGAVIHIQPTATNSKGKAHIAQVSITQGNQAVTMGGTGPNGFANGVTTSRVMKDGRYQSALYNTPTATDITLGADGDLYYNNANGSMGAEITPKSHGGQTDLDGAGGGLVGDPTATTSSLNTQQVIQQLIAVIAGEPQSFYSVMMMQELSQLMSQSTSQLA
jgi:hypothetical protein